MARDKPIVTSIRFKEKLGAIAKSEAQRTNRTADEINLSWGTLDSENILALGATARFSTIAGDIMAANVPAVSQFPPKNIANNFGPKKMIGNAAKAPTIASANVD